MAPLKKKIYEGILFDIGTYAMYVHCTASLTRFQEADLPPSLFALYT